ncbi:ATP-dependent 3'-5' DNA helicase [Coemansia sp. RSA 1200]|nr:ATP-dependent 3'-5' DNA helicase [Coemansia sp. RSA 1200]
MPELIALFRPFVALSLFILRSSRDGDTARPIAFKAVSDAMRSSLGLALAEDDLLAFAAVLDDDDGAMLSVLRDDSNVGYNNDSHDNSLRFVLGPAFVAMDLDSLVALFAKRHAVWTENNLLRNGNSDSDNQSPTAKDLALSICDKLRLSSVLETMIPSAPAQYADPTCAIDSRIWIALKEARSIDRLYSHQAKAIDCVLGNARRDVVVSTGTASGKSIVYQVAVLQMLLQSEEENTILLMFPTKALAQDQLVALRSLVCHIPELSEVVIDTLDGDKTHRETRRAIRDTASVILTNPDTLHAAMLPAGTHAWRSFWQRLRLVVIDEMHVYQAQFGQHVAHILHRLQRICCWAQGKNIGGSELDVRFVACTATTANPAEHMCALTGCRSVAGIEVVDLDGSPRGSKHMALWCSTTNSNSSSTSNVSSRPLSAASNVCNVAMQLLAHGLRIVVFCKSRQTCELVFREISDCLERSPTLRIRKLQTRIVSYRAGYTAAERRAIEQSIFAGDTRLVVATNALELGIDIGSLDAVLMVGVPTSVASLWQQAGRAGRRTRDSLAIIMADPAGNPIDKRTVDAPSGLFDRVFAPATVANEQSITAAHLQCAAFELPFAANEMNNTEGLCWDPVLQRWICALSFKPWPADKVHIRSVQQIGTDWQVVDTGTTGAPTLLEVLDAYHALFALYEGGILLHRGYSYSIDCVDPVLRVALVSKSNVSWYTVKRDYIDAVPLSVVQSRTLSSDSSGKLEVCYGEINVTAIVFGYKRIDTRSRKLLELVEHRSPPLTIKTNGVWLDVPLSIAKNLAASGHNVEASIHAAQHALIAEVGALVGCLSADLSTECKSPLATRSKIPRLVVYEQYPVVRGPTERLLPVAAGLFKNALTRLDKCSLCPSGSERGCLSCVLSKSCNEYNECLDKPGGMLLLNLIVLML